MEKTIEVNVLRRGSVKTLIGGCAVAAWNKPLMNSMILPAHAQTSMNLSITVSSLDADNPFARFILIVDSSDNVLANCGASGGTATASGLNAGDYRVFADSNGLQNHQVSITTNTDNQSFTVPTNTGSCDFLVATISMPSGVITPASGEQIISGWSCSTQQGTGCS